MKKAWVFVLIILYTTLASCQTIADTPNVSKGVIDMSGYDWDADKIFRLDGEWEFYWNRLLLPGDFGSVTKPTPDGYIKVPGVWNEYVVDGKPVGETGYATYRILITNKYVNKMLGLKLPEVSTCYRLFANGIMVIDGGNVSTNLDELRESYANRIAFFYNTNRIIEIVLQVGNKIDVIGGLFQGVFIGSESAIILQRDYAMFSEIFLIGALFIMALYHLVLYFNRRKEKSSLYFSLFCIAIALRATVSGEGILGALLPALEWVVQVRIAFITIYLAVMTFVLFFRELFRETVWKWFTWIDVIISGIYILVSLIAPTRFYVMLFPGFEAVMLASGAYVIITLIRLTIKNREGAIFILVAFILLFGVVINDLLYYNRIILTGFLLPLGLLVFIFFQSLVLSMRIARALSTAENLSGVLDARVKERTSELETERNKLQVKNEMMRRDLQMAKVIQKQFIPSKSPLPSLAFYYQPMEMVGGDFFDFIRLGGDNLGILVSDVSGHGVPAAFITSMIKSYTLQFADVIDNPAEFMMQLNQLLVNQTGGNFVTAFYGIINTSTRKLVFSNAGHNSPYIIERKGIRMMETEFRGVPLGIFDNDELTSRREVYRNETVTFAKGDKILLYTDGLIETVNINDSEALPLADTRDFGSELLIPILEKNRKSSANILIDDLIENLVRFRGGNTFEDDVCVICMDI
ncbi:MAG: SpoIIE family protein phosphatase [Brevinematales bacterium]|nr:SpoIIE family protein phosphatase [Brevinematales bacterium]